MCQPSFSHDSPFGLPVAFSHAHIWSCDLTFATAKQKVVSCALVHKMARLGCLLPFAQGVCLELGNDVCDCNKKVMLSFAGIQ